MDRAMETIHETYMGIDPTAGQFPFTWAVLSETGNLLQLEEGELDEIIQYTEEQKPAFIAVNAPRNTNRGLVRNLLTRENPSVSPRGADLRLCEYELRVHGILVAPTPSRLQACPEWIQLGINLHKELERKGYQIFSKRSVVSQLVEVNAHAIFCALLQQVPMPKPSLEGRIQRQLVLHESGEGVKDPMDFYEEITRHRILRGSLPVDCVYAPQELDALAAAFTAWYVKQHPEEVTCMGDNDEGEIVIPVNKIKDMYS